MQKNRLFILAGVAAVVTLLILIVVLSVELTRKKPRPSSPNAWDNYRLSNTTLPTTYTIIIQPLIEDNRFQGNVSIALSVTQATSVIYLHQYKLNITNTMLMDQGNNAVSIASAFAYNQNEYWVIRTGSVLNPGNYTLSMQFFGSFLDGTSQSIVGYYRSSYVDKSTNTTKYMATTKFEPTYARRGFPCFDEPNKKARFQISIVHDSLRPTALSNMAKTKVEPFGGNWTKTTFAMSIPMSTYLVCFIACDFDNITKTAANNVPVTAYAPKDRISQTVFALEVALKVLVHYDEYFGIPYNKSIPKLDLVSVPDFVSGAMENWGIITFRETNFLFQEGISSASAEERVCEVVAHEIAHMWFGNLVTMDWWDDLWLNEGFATFMAYTQGIAVYAPQWNSDSAFVVDELQSVLPADAALSSHPIVVKVNHPDEINSIFDSITYNKGSSVLRMLDAYMNQEKANSFKTGIQEYLKKYMYQNAKTDDLWAVLQASSGIAVSSIMGTWTKQMGFPMLTFNATGKSIGQTRFYANPEDKGKGTALSWSVPLTFLFANTSTGSLLINHNATTVPFDAGQNVWVKLNVEEKGFYRVNYDNNTWNSLTDQLKSNLKVFNPGDRAQLVDDSFALAASAIIDYSVPLKLIAYLKSETEFWPPWDSFLSELAYVSNMLKSADNATYTKLKSYINANVASQAFESVWTSNVTGDNNRKQLQSYVIKIACGVEASNCIGNISSLFNQWIQNESLVLSPDFKSSVLAFGIKQSGEAEWNTTWTRYLNAPVAEKTIYRSALAKSQDEKTLNRYLALAWDPINVRRQDYLSVLAYIAGNPVGTPLIYAYVKSNWMKLVGRFTLNDRYFGRLIPSITSRFNTQAQLTDLQNFFQKYPDAGAGVAGRKQAISNIQKNIAWMQNRAPSIKAWLNTQEI